LGYIPPTAGAVLQEVIDVAVILNALRASDRRLSRSDRTGPAQSIELPAPQLAR
jgi:hypothetical protein